MHRYSYHTSASSGPPAHQPPPPGLDRYASYGPPPPLPPPPASFPLPPPPPQKWDGRDRRDDRERRSGRDGYDRRDRHDVRDGRDRHDGRDGRDARDGRDGRDGRSGRDRYPLRDLGDGYRDRDFYSDQRQHRESYQAPRDDYRPPRGDFTFRQEAPAGISSYGRSSNSRHDDRSSNNGRTNHYDESRRTRGGQRPTGPRYPGPRQRRPPEKAVDRLLLSKKFDDQPELMLGDTAVRATYRDVDELSDSDEVDMDISDNGDDDSNALGRPAKRVRTEASDAPKWSNPDPYTALPPPETTRKKDVVQLIRKARVEAEAKKPAISTEAADFISCDFSEDDTANHAGAQIAESRRPDTAAHMPDRPARSHAASSTLPPRPPPSTAKQASARSESSAGAHATEPSPRLNASPSNHARRDNKTSTPVDLTPSASLGNRKRTIDDEIKMPIKPPHAPLKKVNRMASAGTIDEIWKPKPGEDPCPWVVEDHSGVPNMGTRLHFEIMDFYEYVRPRDFEERVRKNLVKELETLIRKKWRQAKILPFGSFMSGLYLPTADMDLAICSQDFIDGKHPLFDSKKSLWQMKAHLEKNNVAFRRTVEAITRAKVPLLKYTDDKTGLKLDLSFEKRDGHNAINTFLKWKEQYPAMPPLVALIKQFLLMRGLNEPVNGGIGGFTIICMVVHMLQMMPQVQSGSMRDEHLGELFMKFLKYYGEEFKYEQVAIRMDPPGLVNKAQASTLVYRNLDRLSIIDPNNPENDISGGSQNFFAIKDRFAQALDILQKRGMQLAKGQPASDWKKNTLLYPILAGNYAHFRVQRNWLQKLDRQGFSDYDGPETANGTDDSQW
ncbi:hypothetical protein F5Y14DRAFT_362320 [Nemania sp. NC0429]|nr:hypothetical protein F5Y14DRAFT_362320 [Nemania sp. NC0429]